MRIPASVRTPAVSTGRHPSGVRAVPAPVVGTDLRVSIFAGRPST